MLTRITRTQKRSRLSVRLTVTNTNNTSTLFGITDLPNLNDGRNLIKFPLSYGIF